MLNSVNHIGIAVKDLENSLVLYSKIFNPSEVHYETVPEQKVKIASFKVGDVRIELTAPTDESSPIHKFIEKKGEGLHHIAVHSDNLNSDISHLKNEGIDFTGAVSEGAHDLMITFIHPKSANGVLLEICGNTE